jgi:Domain of unknown function (DUF1905)
MPLTFTGKIVYWKGPSPYYFVTIPEEQSQDIKAISKLVTYGWGVIPVSVQIGQTRWSTSLFPKDDRYLVPIKNLVRKAEKLAEGDTVTVQLEVGKRKTLQPTSKRKSLDVE